MVDFVSVLSLGGSLILKEGQATWLLAIYSKVLAWKE